MSGVLYLISFLVGGVGVLSAGGILAWQALQWLQFGYWTSVTITDVLASLGVSSPSFRWVGAQKIVDFILAFPGSFGVLVVFLTVAGFFSHLAGDEERFHRDKARAKLDAEINARMHDDSEL